MTIALSLVICTRNRSRQLERCLAAVGEIDSTRPWEVVVVDNASTDGTRSLLDAAAGHFPVPLRAVHEPVPGVARARNTGWRSASGAVVAYTDDDCYPEPDLVERILERFDEDPRLGFVGGAVLAHEPGDAAVGVVALKEPETIEPGGFLTPGLLISANLAFRRSVLEAIGGFDPVFGYGPEGFAGEDADAAARALAAGWRGRYEPSLRVRHHHGRGGPELARTRRAYDLGRGAFFAKRALDRRTRRTYLGGWLRLTSGRVRRGGDLGAVARELRGAARYLRLRWSARWGPAAPH